MSVAIIVQARMGSTRLPQKVLKTVLQKPLLAYQLERVARVQTPHQLIVATTQNSIDQPLVSFCKDHGVLCFQGPEDDVLTRYYQAVSKYPADVVVRLTADCPLIDPAVVDLVIQDFLQSNGAYDYVSNTLQRTYPRGMDIEVFSFDVLKDIHHKAQNHSDREHVTPYVYNHPEDYKVHQVLASKDNSHIRLTVDTLEDFVLVAKILEELYPKNPEFTLDDVLSKLQQNPDWIKINQHIEQKTPLD